MTISECKNLNYFKYLKSNDDSRCYLFGDSNNCILQTYNINISIYNFNQSFICYKPLDQTCINSIKTNIGSTFNGISAKTGRLSGSN